MGEVRVGIIGAGFWAIRNHMHILEARDDVDLVAVSRMGEGELRQVKDELGFRYACVDYRDGLKREMDSATVSSPAKFQYETTLAELELCFNGWGTEGRGSIDVDAGGQEYTSPRNTFVDFALGKKVGNYWPEQLGAGPAEGARRVQTGRPERLDGGAGVALC